MLGCTGARSLVSRYRQTGSDRINFSIGYSTRRLNERDCSDARILTCHECGYHDARERLSISPVTAFGTKFHLSRISLCIPVFPRNSDCRVCCQPTLLSFLAALPESSLSRPLNALHLRARRGSSGLSRFESYQNPNKDVDV